MSRLFEFSQLSEDRLAGHALQEVQEDEREFVLKPNALELFEVNTCVAPLVPV